MALFGEDPKDLVITTLQDEVAYLRQKNQELQDQILALTNAQAFRLTHPTESVEQPSAPLTGPWDNRGKVYTPKLTAEEVRQKFEAES